MKRIVSTVYFWKCFQSFETKDKLCRKKRFNNFIFHFFFRVEWKNSFDNVVNFKKCGFILNLFHSFLKLLKEIKCRFATKAQFSYWLNFLVMVWLWGGFILLFYFFGEYLYLSSFIRNHIKTISIFRNPHQSRNPPT